MLGRYLSERHQQILLQCVKFILYDGGLEGEFDTLLGADEQEVALLIADWPNYKKNLSDDGFLSVALNVTAILYDNLLDCPKSWPTEFDFNISDLNEVVNALKARIDEIRGEKMGLSPHVVKLRFVYNLPVIE